MNNEVIEYINLLIHGDEKLRQFYAHNGAFAFATTLVYRFKGDIYVHRESESIIWCDCSPKGYHYYNAFGALPDYELWEVIPIKYLNLALKRNLITAGELSEEDHKSFIGFCDKYDFNTDGCINHKVNGKMHRIDLCTKKDGLYLYDVSKLTLYTESNEGLQRFIADNSLEGINTYWFTVEDHLNPAYKYDKGSGILTVYEEHGVYEFCQSQGIKLQLFNMPVVLSSKMTSCYRLFSGCFSFNQKVEFPPNCTDFGSCFSGCSMYNQPTIIPNGAIDCSGMFYDCSRYDQETTVPASVKRTDSMFGSCKNLRHRVHIGANQLSENTFDGCKYMNSDGTICAYL